MNYTNFKAGAYLNWRALLLFIVANVTMGKAVALTALITSDLSNGYSACSWVENGDGTSTVRVSISFKSASGHTGYSNFVSRGLLIYTYGRNGTPEPNRAVIRNIKMDGVQYNLLTNGSDYFMAHGYGVNSVKPWTVADPVSGAFEVVVNNSLVEDWPAIGLRAGNLAQSADVAEIKGAAYISRYGNDTTRTCKVVEPTNPPPPIITINVTAPDWNLGDLQPGDNEKGFASSADQLCFTYTGTAVSGKKFVINASNENGVVNGRYRLKHVSDASQTVPYNVKLDSGASTLSLPNTGSATVPLSTSGKTCFVPTFTATVGERAKNGDYSDVLTFTVITKS
ncbi:hypothetical protein [Burkholderia ambifaria]|uniref:hypothetical protein n=1 Tax=Burkholderia ambifaria TaxID=152480 RepID=UPI000F7FFD29|nr:hypothetical protein [Burkholderia ambifaria]WDR86015.1 hypothetical protein OR986_06250 [Burkholderia ambifaria]WDR98645.1 hypothetical protein OR985_11200 [Burkholderia ambifaria]